MRQQPNSERDKAIAAMFEQGASIREINRMLRSKYDYEIHRSRIYQIIEEQGAKRRANKRDAEIATLWREGASINTINDMLAEKYGYRLTGGWIAKIATAQGVTRTRDDLVQAKEHAVRNQLIVELFQRRLKIWQINQALQDAGYMPLSRVHLYRIVREHKADEAR